MLDSENSAQPLLDDGMARAYDLLAGSEHRQGSDLLADHVRLLMVAIAYWHFRVILQPVSIGRSKADYERHARRLSPLVQSLEKIPSQALIAFSHPRFRASLILRDSVPPPERTKSQQRDMVRFAAAWEADVLATPPARFGKAILEAIHSLIEVYVTVTGLEPTHSTDTVEQLAGFPRSEFGKFCVAFFAAIDPTVSQKTIAGVIRKQLRTRRRSMRIEAVDKTLRPRTQVRADIVY